MPTSWRSARPAFGGCSARPVSCRSGWQAVEERYGLRAAASCSSALAHRCFLPQHRRTFYYLCSILDGYSRYIVNWDIRESMTEADIEIILQRAKERFPEA